MASRFVRRPAAKDSVAFVRDMLPKTSRTFALTVPLLPAPLADIVSGAYLLCRVADTLEDEADVPVGARVELLSDLGVLVALPGDWREQSASLAGRACGLLRQGTPTDEASLVAGLPTLLDDLAGRPLAVRELVRTCVQDMATGMGETLLLAKSPKRPVFEDLDEVLGYCDIVAGTVGRMLTGLFAWHSGGVAAALPELEPRADAFGRALQLTNIIKDVPSDLAAGRCWLPRSVLADCGIDSPEQLADPALAARARGVLECMIAPAHREITEATAYIEAIPVSDAAIRRFCVAPLMLALLTLRKLWDTPDPFAAPVKISRRAVGAAMRTTRALGARPAALGVAIELLRRPLPRPLPPHGTPIPRAIEPQRSIDDGIEAAVNKLVTTQSPTGSWFEEYGNVPMFLSVYVITCYTVGAMPDKQTGARMERYYRTYQNPDGGWGLDTESDSLVLPAVLAYTALRLLGVPADDPCLRRARDFFLPHGGALAAPHLGKVYLAVLGVYDWKGVYPFVPELFLLPRRLPVHPGRSWGLVNQVYLAASWLYGRRAVTPSDPLLRELREELYAERYANVDWARARGVIARPDSYVPRSWLLKAAFAGLSGYEMRPSRALRARAMAAVLDHIGHENRTSNYVGLGPVAKSLHTLVWHFARPGGEEVTAHVNRLPEYLWDGPDGTKVQCFNSTESWTTSFAVQALARSGHPGALPALKAASGFLAAHQRLTAIPDAERYFRHTGRGGWTLSTAEQAWSISDGTAEALKAVLDLDELGLTDEFTPERRAAAVGCILSMQNRDGGWAVYQESTAPTWMHKLNFSDAFDQLMLDGSGVEPTASCVTALRRYRERHPHDHRDAIDRAIRRGEEFILSVQLPGGSWEGNWGVCFTYGTRFGVLGLASSSHPRARAAVDRACEFLLGHQRGDGGWGETIEACRARRYIHAETSQAANTAWAVLALVDAGRAMSPAVDRATGFLLRAQHADGGWLDDHMSGVFSRTTAMNYAGYQRIFPLWALSAVADARKDRG